MNFLVYQILAVLLAVLIPALLVQLNIGAVLRERFRLKQLQGKNMDPITVLGAIASIIEIAKFLEARGQPFDAQTIERVFNQRASEPGSLESNLELGQVELKHEIDRFLSLRSIDEDFLDRIDGKCLPPYRDAVRDHGKSTADVDEAYEIARRCVCENIALARRHNGGVFPSDDFKQLWDKFGCGML